MKKTKEILLVEDDPFLIDIYTTKLREAGFKVEAAQEREAIWRKLKEEKPDLLLLDIVLPDVDGWQLMEKIKQDKNLREIKVVILSNLGQKYEVAKGLKLGAIKYLIKAQYTPSQVVEEIKKII